MTAGGGSNGDGTIFSIGTGGTGYQVLYSFGASGTDGNDPQGSLTLSSDGSTLYGMTQQGGGNGQGTVFSIRTNGSGYQILYSFGASGTDSEQPYGSLTLSSDGSTLYGMTQQGGANAEGTVFSIGTGGTGYQVLYSFGASGTDGQNPYGSLTLSSDGSTLYGMTNSGGGNGQGTVFSIGVSGLGYQILYSFGASGTDGQNPYGSLTLSSDGSTLYGMTNGGGANAEGTVFSIGIVGTGYQVLYSFGASGTDGEQPYGSLTLSSDGSTLYGMTAGGGSGGVGTVFSIGANGLGYQLLYSFAGTNGQIPHGSLTLSTDDSTLYGMTMFGGFDGSGAAFSMGTNGSGYQLLYSFGQGGTDAAEPSSSLILSSDGSTLYSMTRLGGSYGQGTIFSIGANGSGYRILYSFGASGTDGEFPYGSLTLSSGGNTLYGMTSSGGSNYDGTVFSIRTNGSGYQLLYSFGASGTDGESPQGSLTLSSDGSTLYGMTNSGGGNGDGTIFSIGANGLGYQILYSFGASGTDGQTPYASLTLSSDGSTVYGMTAYGGANMGGTVFSIGTGGTGYQVLYSFSASGTDGQNPYGSLTLSSNGSTLYGMTNGGGSNSQGAIFSVRTNGSGYQILYSFGASGTDGESPQGSLTLSSDGSTIYGMTPLGGSNSHGTAFSVGTDGSGYQILYSFGASGTDGEAPNSSPILSSDDRTLYGMTNLGGSTNGGTVFEFGL